MNRTIIYLIRNDLRLHDNACLLFAHQNSDHLIPLYCFDPDHYKGTYHFNFAKSAEHRTKFNVDSVKDLKISLKNRGSTLVVRHSRPSEAIKGLIDACKTVAPVSSVVFQQEVTKEELDVEASIAEVCKANGVQLKSFWGSTLFHKEDLPFGKRDIPDTYTQFRKSVEGRSGVRGIIQSAVDKLKPPVEGIPEGEIPSPQELGVAVEKTTTDERSAFPFVGGETTGLERLHEYLWDTNCVETYKETRNGLVGKNYSTKFSAWLANGSLSPRMIYHEIKRYEASKVANQSTYWVIFELIWRDYFKFVCWKYGDRVFYKGGIMGKDYDWSTDKVAFKRWCLGETGVPFVDANMRELKETGWMSNRGRQNVASFLIKDLNLDWRLGAEWFESQLIDHDVCSNYGNWNYSAGIGNDPRENRKFNMIKQGLDYDGEGKFIKTWIPELSKLPGGKVHVPWALSESELRTAGVEIGQTYPKPMVIAPEWGRHTHKTGGVHQAKPKGQKGIDFYFKGNNKGRRRVQ